MQNVRVSYHVEKSGNGRSKVKHVGMPLCEQGYIVRR